MELILLERIAKLGQMGDLVRVKAGYARNYLLPAGKALRATDENRKLFEARRKELEARNLELRKEAEGVAEHLDGREFVLIRSASGVGSLYGSVSARDIWQAAADDGVSLSRQQIQLNRPIKDIGMHDVSVMLHPEVEVSIKVNVARSEQEAVLQAQGRTVISELDEFDEDAEVEGEPEADEMLEASEPESTEETPEDAPETEES